MNIVNFSQKFSLADIETEIRKPVLLLQFGGKFTRASYNNNCPR